MTKSHVGSRMWAVVYTGLGTVGTCLYDLFRFSVVMSVISSAEGLAETFGNSRSALEMQGHLGF